MTDVSTGERRQHSRIAFQTCASLVLAGRTVDVVVLDLSLKGALIRFPADGELVCEEVGSLQVQLNAEVSGDQISAEVQIVHIKGLSAGLRCLSIDLDSITHLRRLVELNLGDPQLLERELSALIAD